jgi:hypothetical protein
MEFAVAVAVLALLVLVFVFVRFVRPRGTRSAPVDDRSDFDRLIGKPASPNSPRGSTDHCRWVRDHFRNDRVNTRWVCDTCGAEVLGPSAAKPERCRRDEARLAMKKGD